MKTTRILLPKWAKWLLTYDIFWLSKKRTLFTENGEKKTVYLPNANAQYCGRLLTRLIHGWAVDGKVETLTLSQLALDDKTAKEIFPKLEKAPEEIIHYLRNKISNVEFELKVLRTKEHPAKHSIEERIPFLEDKVQFYRQRLIFLLDNPQLEFRWTLIAVSESGENAFA